jgi:hypothetical protein
LLRPNNFFFTFFNILNPLNQTVGGHVELVETLARAFNPNPSHISRHARNDNALYYLLFTNHYCLFAILTLPAFSTPLEMTTHGTIPNSLILPFPQMLRSLSMTCFAHSPYSLFLIPQSLIPKSLILSLPAFSTPLEMTTHCTISYSLFTIPYSSKT